MQHETVLDLADTTQEAESNLAKAHLLCQELCEQYFQFVNLPYHEVQEQQGYIVWEYRHFALYAHIIQDYLQQTEVLLAVISSYFNDCLPHPGAKPRSRAPQEGR